MQRRMLLALLLSATTADAMTIDATRITFGTTFGGAEVVQVKSAKPFTITKTGEWCWHPGLVVSPLGGVGPTTVTLTLDKAKARANEVDHTYLAFTDADGTAILDVRVSCSGNSGCGQPPGNPSGSRPSCSIGAPTAQRTATPLPVRTATPLPGQPTPQPTWTVWPMWPPSATRTPVPTAISTSLPPSQGNRPIAQPGPKVPPVRPMSYRVVSYKRDFAKPRQWAYFPDGSVTTADNASMDAQEHVRLSAVQELTALLDDPKFLECFDEVQETINVSQGISHIYRDLMGPYVVAGKLNDGARGSWEDEDAYYNIVGYSMRRYQRCLLGKTMAAPCATLPADYLDVLDLRVDAGKCVPGAAFTYPPNPVFNKAQQHLGPLTADHLMPAYSASQLALLNAATGAHACASLAVLDGRACPGGTQEKLRQWEASAVNAEQQHAMQLAPFPKADKRWPEREHKALALGELYTWGDGSGSMPLSWDGQQRGEGNWGKSRAAEFAHDIYHSIAAHLWVRWWNTTWVDRSPPYRYRLPCKVNGKFTYGNDCVEETQAQIVNRALRGDYGIYTP